MREERGEHRGGVRTGGVLDRLPQERPTAGQIADVNEVKRPVERVSFHPDGTRIVIGSAGGMTTVWDAVSGKELPAEGVPDTLTNPQISPDGRFLAQMNDLTTRRNLLPPPEQKILTAQAAAEREIAAGRTQDALSYLAVVSAARPEDWEVATTLAALWAWFGQDREFADLCGRVLESARGTSNAVTAHAAARICCLSPTSDKTRQEAALALARKAVELDETNPYCRLTLGIAEYRSGHFAEAAAALTAAAAGHENGNHPDLAGQSAFFRAMILFRQGKADEARKLAVEAALMTEGPRTRRTRRPVAVPPT